MRGSLFERARWVFACLLIKIAVMIIPEIYIGLMEREALKELAARKGLECHELVKYPEGGKI